MMGCGLKKVGNLLAELDSRKGIGLITRIRQGLGRPDRIYVRKCTQQDMYKRNIQTRQNDISGNAKMTGTDMSEMPGNDTEDNKTEISDTDRSDTEYLSFYSEESEEIGRCTADGLRSHCSQVSPSEAKPGDLIFFQGTYNTSGASHVGIYVGNNMMIHCGKPVQYTSIASAYWQEHFMAFGRLH